MNHPNELYICTYKLVSVSWTALVPRHVLGVHDSALPLKSPRLRNANLTPGGLGTHAKAPEDATKTAPPGLLHFRDPRGGRTELRPVRDHRPCRHSLRRRTVRVRRLLAADLPRRSSPGFHDHHRPGDGQVSAPAGWRGRGVGRRKSPPGAH